MEAVKQLERDHRIIECALEMALSALSPFEPDRMEQTLAFLSEFVGKIHHAKEEELLFQAIAKRAGEVAVEPVRDVKREHQVAYDNLTAARSALQEASRGNSEALRDLNDSIQGYARLLRAHIRKEESILYRLAELAVPESQDRDLADRFTTLQEDWLRGSNLELYQTLDQKIAEDEARAPADAGDILEGRVSPFAPLDEPADAPSPNSSVTTLFSSRNHENIWLRDFGRGLLLKANQFVITHDNHGMILDPGGPKVYPDIVAEVKQCLGNGRLSHIFLSHQDPDVGTALNAWLMDTDADAYVSQLWIRFLPHFGIDNLLHKRLHPIPDEGMVFDFAGSELIFLPAHFLHSCGNFQVYDPVSKVLFSGDVGASFGMDYAEVSDFDAHTKLMRPFHERYMASRETLRAWVAMVRTLDVEIIAPQHGALLKGRDNVERFLGWCEDSRCGIDLLHDEYKVPSSKSQ